MIAVIFEVWPKPERKKEYLDIAARLNVHRFRTTAAACMVDRFANVRLGVSEESC